MAPRPSTTSSPTTPGTSILGVRIRKSFTTSGAPTNWTREALVRLCRSIGRVCGVEVHDPLAGEQVPTDDPVLAPGVRQIRTRPLGVVWVVEALWARLGLDRLFKGFAAKVGAKADYERALLAMTVNRLG